MDIKLDPIDKLLEQFCDYEPFYREWRWKLESFYELTEEELNIIHWRVRRESAQKLRVDVNIMYHLAKKLCK